MKLVSSWLGILFSFVAAVVCTTETLTLEITPQAPVVTQHSQLLQVLASLQPTDNVNENQRAPLDLVLVVDTSGSMNVEPIRLTKQVLTFLTEELGEQDQIAIIKYSQTVETVLHPTIMNQEGRARALSRVQTLFAAGGTFLSGGLAEGTKMINEMLRHERYNENGVAVPVVVMMSDGYANQGLTQVEDIIQQVYDITGVCRERALPFSIYSFAIGNNVDHLLMSSIGEIGNGAYFHVSSSQEIGSSLAGLVGNLFSTVGKGVSVHFQVPEELANEVEIVSVGGSYPFVQHSKRYFEVFVGDVQSSPRDLLVELNFMGIEMEEGSERVSKHVLDVWWNGYDLVTDRDMVMASKQSVVIDREFSSLSEEEIHEKMEQELPENILLQRERQYVAEQIEFAYEASSRGNKEDAEAILLKTAERVNDENLKRAITNLKETSNSPAAYLSNIVEVTTQRFSGVAGSAYQSEGSTHTMNKFHVWEEEQNK